MAATELHEKDRAILEAIHFEGGECDTRQIKEYTGMEKNKIWHRRKHHLVPDGFVECEVVDHPDGGNKDLTIYELTDEGSEVIVSILNRDDSPPPMLERLDELAEDVRETNRELHKLRESVGAVSGRMDEIEERFEEIEESTSEVSEIEEEIDTLRIDVEHVETVMESLRDDREDVVERISALKDREEAVEEAAEYAELVETSAEALESVRLLQEHGVLDYLIQAGREDRFIPEETEDSGLVAETPAKPEFPDFVSHKIDAETKEELKREALERPFEEIAHSMLDSRRQKLWNWREWHRKYTDQTVGPQDTSRGS